MKAEILLDHDALHPTETKHDRRLVRALVRVAAGAAGAPNAADVDADAVDATNVMDATNPTDAPNATNEASGKGSGEEAKGPAVADLSLEVRPAAGELGVIHHSYPRVPTPDGLRFELGDLRPRETRRVLLEFAVAVPSTEDAAATLPVAQVIVAGSVPRARGEGERQELHLPVAITPGDGPRSEPEVRHELALLAAGRARRDADAARGVGSARRAREILRRAARRVRRVSERHPEPRSGARRLVRVAGSLEAEAERRGAANGRRSGRPPTTR